MKLLRYPLLLLAQAAAPQRFCFSCSMLEVVENVTVLDRQGKPLDKLTANDFSVREDGVPQTISQIDFENFGVPARAVPASNDRLGAHLYFRNSRLLLFLFDCDGVPSDRLAGAVGAVKEFVANKMEPADQVAIFRRRDGKLREVAEYTGDRRALLGELETFAEPDPVKPFDRSAADDFGSSADRHIRSLIDAQRRNGVDQEAVIWFTSAAEFEGAVNRAAIRSLVNQDAAKSTSINPIDLGSQSASAAARDMLRFLAAETGGTAIFDWNGSPDALVTVQQSIQSHYAILYYSRQTDISAKPRHVEITCVSHPDAHLQYPGLYFLRRNLSDVEGVLKHGLEDEDPMVDMPVALDSRLADAGAFTLRIPKEELVRAYQSGEQNPAIEIAGEVRDGAGKRVAGVRDRLTVPLVKPSGELDRTENAQFDFRFDLPPGSYTAKFRAVEAYRRRAGTYWLDFVVP